MILAGILCASMACVDNAPTGPEQNMLFEVWPFSPSEVAVGSEILLTTFATRSTGGQVVEVACSDYDWQSDNGSIATVRSTGVVTGNKVGQTIIRVNAECEGVRLRSAWPVTVLPGL